MRIFPKYKTKARREKALARVAKREVPSATDWETLRPLILEKTGGFCYLCGVELYEWNMTTDHMVIRPAGCKKNDAFSNLMPCCRRDNFRKGSRRLTGESCKVCGQKFLVKGLHCLRCERLGTDVRRTMRTTI